MKTVTLILLLLLLCPVAYACPDFQGIYSGTCHVTYRGEESSKEMPIGISQQGCEQFNFNDLTANFYTIGKSTIYTDKERTFLKRADVSEDEKALYLRQTVERKSEKTGHSLSVSTYVFKKLNENEIRYDGETFDFEKGEVSVITSCPSLKKGE